MPEDCSITLENSQEYKLHQGKRIHQLVMLENRNKLKVFFFFFLNIISKEMLTYTFEIMVNNSFK